MIKPMMQNPISPAMELCICCGIAPPVTWLVGVVVFCDFVGATLLANVASLTLAKGIQPEEMVVSYMSHLESSKVV